MAKQKPAITIDHRYDRLNELKRKLERAWDSGELMFEEDHPEVAALREEYDALHAELYPKDVWAEILEDTEREGALMDDIEGLLADRRDLRQLFEGQSRDARAIELEKSPELRQKILTELKGDEE